MLGTCAPWSMSTCLAGGPPWRCGEVVAESIWVFFSVRAERVLTCVCMCVYVCRVGVSATAACRTRYSTCGRQTCRQRR